MASFFNKWFVLSGFLFAFFNTLENYSVTATKLVSTSSESGLHPFHVSVVEVNQNAADKTLEISCKIFTDDFEKVLVQNYKTKVDLINPPNKTAMDTLVKRYILSHLSVSVDGKPGNLVYVGFERENEAVLSYVQIDNINTAKKIELTNKLMHDMFTDQINIVHVVVNGERKSTKLDYPATAASFQF